MEDANAAADEALAMAADAIATMTQEAVIYALVSEPGKMGSGLKESEASFAKTIN